MAVKYRIEYKDIEGVSTRIDITDNDYTDFVIELTPAANPLEIDMPSGSDIFEPVQGSGGTIRVLAKDSDNLRGLYTADPKKYKVNIYKNGTTSSDIILFGYVNTGFYEEGFNEYDNYEVAIGFNDGLSLLKRYDYLNSGAKFTGTDNVLAIVTRMVSKIGLSFHKISVCTDMYYDGYTISSSDTILEHLKINNSNYYDEQGEPMTFREVMEGVLKPLGLVCFTQGGILYIIDPLKLQETTYTVKNFSLSTGLYVDSTIITPNQDIGTDISWWQTGTQLDFMKGYNKLRLDYSGYASDNILGITNWSDKENHSSEGTWSWHGEDPEDGDDYEENTTWGGISGFTLYNTAYWRGTRFENKEEFHCIWSRTDPDGGGDGLTRIKYTGDSEYIRGIDDQFLKIKFGMYIKTATGYYNPRKDKDTGYGVWQNFRIKVGSKYWNQNLYQWQAPEVHTDIPFKAGFEVNDSWFDFECLIPLDPTIDGQLEITLYDKSSLMGYTWNIFEGYPDQREFMVKDMVVTIANTSGEDIDYDLKYECGIDGSLWQEEAPTLDMIHGDSSDGVASHRGGLINDGNEFATDFRYGNMTAYHILPKVIFKKYESQYRESRMKLNGYLTGNDIYSTGLAKTGNISDSVNLTGRKFVLLDGKYNDRDKYIRGNWIEILADNIEIT